VLRKAKLPVPGHFRDHSFSAGYSETSMNRAVSLAQLLVNCGLFCCEVWSRTHCFSCLRAQQRIYF
jgi:hypothetical protein